MQSSETTARTLDGLHLSGTLVLPDSSSSTGVVLVHGGGVTRDEGGFFTRLAAGLGEAGVPTLRYDLRGHGQSEGRQEEATLLSHLNDIRVARDHLREVSGAQIVNVLGTSFGGGLAAYYAAKCRDGLTRLVLLNPQLDYKNRYVDQKSYWSHDFLNDDKARELAKQGYIRHSPTVKHGRGLLNEVFWISPKNVLGEIVAPTLIMHGTKDTFVSVDSSRAAVPLFRAPCELIEIEGAQHGFAVHEDPQYLNPQSWEWQVFVIRQVCDWFTRL